MLGSIDVPQWYGSASNKSSGGHAMHTFVKDSGLHNLKASVQYCGECCKPQVHYTAGAGCAVCHTCGYSPALELLDDENLPARRPQLRVVYRAA